MIAGWSTGFSSLNITKALVVKTDRNLKPLKAKITLGDRLSNDSLLSMVKTSDSCYVATGWTRNRGVGTPTYSNVFVVKLDQNLNLRWGKVYGDEFENRAQAIIQVSPRGGGGFAVVGWTAVDSDYVTGHRILLIRLDAQGNLTWVKTYFRSIALVDEGYAIAEVPSQTDGGFAIVGKTCLQSYTNFDAFVLRTDYNGNLIPILPYSWLFLAGSATPLPHEVAMSVVCDDSFNIAVAGYTYNYGVGTHGQQANLFVSKFSSRLGPLWSFAYGWPEGSEGAFDDQSLVVTADKNYVVCGSTRSRGVGVPNANFWVLKLKSTDGSVIWSKVHPSDPILGALADEAYPMIQVPGYMSAMGNNGFAVAGYTKRDATALLQHDNFHVVTLNQNGLRPVCVESFSPEQVSFVWEPDTFYSGQIQFSLDSISMTDTMLADTAICGVDNNVGVVVPVVPTGTIDSGTAITPSANVFNFGMATVSYAVRMKIGTFYDQVVSVTNHLPGNTTVVSFPPYSGWPSGTHIVSCSTGLAGDLFPDNDVLYDSITVRIPPRETGCVGHWVTDLPQVPVGPRNKKVKDGGCLAYNEEPVDSINYVDYIYAFKGNNTNEFYQFNTGTNTWATKDTIPKLGSSGRKKAVKKGSFLVGDIAESRPWCVLYGAKGNNTLEFWKYDPFATAIYPWTQVADVPAGTKNVKEGAGAAVADPDRPGCTEPESVWIYVLKGSSTREFYRYHPVSNSWATMADAPLGLSGRPFKKGSAICYNDEEGPGAPQLIYALKGGYNEFYAYDINTNTWATLASLPLIGREGRKKKAGDGAAIMCRMSEGHQCHGPYAIKGNNTLEFWKYLPDSDKWIQLEDFPVGIGKRVKGGGALMYSESTHEMYAMRGNGQLDFYKFVWGSLDAGASSPSQVATGSTGAATAYKLTATPNPFRRDVAINFAVPRAGELTLRLYDVTGKAVTTLASGYHNAGSYVIQVDAAKLAHGIYVLKLESEGTTTSQKLIIE
jgi:hypothetical protein